MAKSRRQRRKLHISKKNAEEKMDTSLTSPNDSISSSTNLPIMAISDNLFAGIEINIDKIKKNVCDDTRSVKSFRSVKSEKGGKILPKKDKIKMRRELLMRKIDTVNQMKKELKLREKRKSVSIIGDTNPLRDSLPSLEPLLRNRTKIDYKIPIDNTKKKGIEKAKTRRKKHLEDFQIFKKTLKDKTFSENPLELITKHIQSVVTKEKMFSKNKKS